MQELSLLISIVTLIIPKFPSTFAFQLPLQVGSWLPHTLNNPFSGCIVECYKLPMEDKYTIFGARFPRGDSVVTIVLIFGVHLGQLPMEDLHSTNYCNYQLRNNNTVPHGRWAADSHQHSLSSSDSTPWKMSSGLSSAQSVIFCTLHHTGDLKTNFIYTSAWMTFVTLRSAQMMCDHVLQQLPWKAPTSSARLLLVRGSSVWPS